MMEIERLKDFQAQIRREAVRKEARYRNGSVLVEQIKAKDVERQMKVQHNELEKVHMRRNIEE